MVGDVTATIDTHNMSIRPDTDDRPTAIAVQDLSVWYRIRLDGASVWDDVKRLRSRRANANHPDHGSLTFATKKLSLPTGRRQVQLIMDDAPKEQNPKVAFRLPSKQS